jgi:16S rRNA processing protein RimM
MSEAEEKEGYFSIARITAPSGLKGELKAQIMTDFPERFARLRTVFVGHNLMPHEVLSARVKGNMTYLRFKDIDSVEAAEKLRGQVVYIPQSEAVALSEDQYYWSQIIGLEVWTTGGERVGKIVDILERPANDVYVVEGPRGEVLLPAIEDVIKEVDLAHGRMVIEPLPGLLE